MASCLDFLYLQAMMEPAYRAFRSAARLPHDRPWETPQRPRLQPAPPPSPLREIANFMDSQYRLPLGIRVGWDGILGLLPGVGDLVTNLVSLYILSQAALLGCPPSVLLRMTGNLLVDNALDAIPLVGNFADFFWRANLRNVEIVESYLATPRRTTVRSRWLVGLGLTFVFLLSLTAMAGAVYATFQFVRLLVAWLG